MVSFFSIMIHVSAVIALVFSVVFLMGIMVKSRAISSIDVFNMCNSQIRACRTASIVFTALYWFAVSGMAPTECLDGYAKLSAMCSFWGIAWIGYAFVNVIISIILGILKRGKDEMGITGRLRKSGFLMGAFFLIVAFILKVN